MKVTIRKYPLKLVMGVKTGVKERFAENEGFKCTLVFERIPDTVREFNLIEGSGVVQGDDGEITDAWQFNNVRLNR